MSTVSIVRFSDRTIYASRANGTVLISDRDFDYLVDRAKESTPSRLNDMRAGEKVYVQVDEMLSQGTSLRDIKASDLVDVKKSTAGTYLSTLRRMVARREISSNPMHIVRTVKRLNCHTLLGII